ncbi:hypothetical protein GLOIN_2v1722794 [Rhizophagus clarus]|uniref:Uncharacterized protein n=1 Tax=Rhizophagus clarus TaxID=94130 RepID=A0A8H3QI82_9GLOM|nr:hypothetical protein GLOIN_2v1722794 [Rhizophagus clarus]
MTRKAWKKLETIKVLEFINENFVLWCKNHQDACAKAAKVHKLDRDANLIYNKVHTLLKASNSPRGRKVLLKSKKIRSLVKEINKKTEELNGGRKRQRKIKGRNNVKTTTNTNQATTSVKKVSQQQIKSVVENVCDEQIKHSEIRIEQCEQIKTNIEGKQIPNQLLSYSISSRATGQQKMPRDKPKRWEVQETIKVLMFLNGNFELWYKTPFVACVRAIEATNIMREGKQVYNKVHGLIQDMEKYLDTGKKANNAIIWENQEIHNLVRNLCVNAREKKRNENQEIPSRAIDGDEMNMDQESVTSEGINDICGVGVSCI